MKKDISLPFYPYLRLIMKLLPTVLFYGILIFDYITGIIFDTHKENGIKEYGLFFLVLVAIAFHFIGYLVNRPVINSLVSIVRETLDNKEIFENRSVFYFIFWSPIRSIDKSTNRFLLTRLAIMICLFAAISFVGVKNSNYDFLYFSAFGVIGYILGLAYTVEAIPFFKVRKELKT